MANVDRAMTIDRGVQLHPVESPRKSSVRGLFSSDRPWVWLAPAVLLLLFIGLYPFIYNIWNSFHEFNPMSGKVEPVGFENWQRLLKELIDPAGRVRAALGTTAMYVSAALIIEFILGLAIAVLFNSGIWAAGF